MIGVTVNQDELRKYMKIILVKEGERNIEFVLKEGWKLKYCKNDILLQCSKGILDINQTIKVVDLA